MALGGLWRAGWSERRGERFSPARFPETKNVRRVPDYNAAIVIRWGVKRTLNAMKLGRRSTNNKTTPHANFHPIPRTFSGHLKNTISDMSRARASVSGLRTDNGRTGEPGWMQVLKHDDAMHMMT